MYGLREKDERIVAIVLEDVKKSITCEIGVGGSLAQRAVSPEMARMLEGKPVHDIDLILIDPGNASPALPSLHTDFHVMEKNSMSGWYFGLTHRKTGAWVDLFTPNYERARKPILFLGKEYEAETIESQVLYLAQNILWRAQTGQTIRRKWPNKLRALMGLHELDTDAIQSEFKGHPDYFASVLPPKTELPANWHSYCELSFKQKCTPLWKDGLRAIKWYFWTRKRYMAADTLPEAVV